MLENIIPKVFIYSTPRLLVFEYFARSDFRAASDARVPADKRGLNYDKYFKDGDTKRTQLSEFNSNNTELLNVEQVKEKLLSLKYIRDELAALEAEV